MKGKSSLTAQSWAMKQQSISYHGDAGTPIKPRTSSRGTPMLKPIEALQEYAQAKGMDAADLQRKQEKLLDALLHQLAPTTAKTW
ncbi:hypothetical protein [Aeromonas veronii]|uniref:hypothetical protein n=1 Tax=Aeromonas veronii TaxID=654 RepID=UPI001F0A8918|nr:hypothetical protein [Aeromonas veronii]